MAVRTRGAFKEPIAPLYFGLEIEFNFAVRKCLFKPFAVEENLTPISPDTNDSIGVQAHMREQIHEYICALLNRKLSTSKGSSIIPEIIQADPKEADPSSWHLTYDESVQPGRETLALQTNIDLEKARSTFRVTGAELG
jgi:hypothetical protein